MFAFTNIYTYSKEKVTELFRLRKPVEVVKEEKTRNGWIKRFFKKYEETQNSSYEYVMYIYNKIKSKSRSTCVSFAFLSFNENSEHATFPWYKKLYLKIKYYIYSLVEIKNSETVIILKEVNENEKKTQEIELSERASSSFSTEDTNIKSTYSSESTVDFISFRNSKKWKTNNSESISEEEGTYITEKNNSMSYLFSKNHTLGFINSFLGFTKNNLTAEAEPKKEDVVETSKVDTNKEEELTNVNESTSDKANVESRLNEDISNLFEKNANLKQSGIFNNMKTFNFRNAITEINKLIF